MILKDLLNNAPPLVRRVAVMLLVAVTYYFSAVWGLSMSFKPDYIAAIWPPNAILLTALLLSRPAHWPLWLIAIIPAELAADLPAGIPLGMALGFAASDWAEVLTAAALVRFVLRKPPEFREFGATLAFFACAAIVAPAVAAIPGALVTGGDPQGPGFWIRMQRWFVSDSLTHLTFTPTLLLWMTRGIRPRVPQRIGRNVEIGLLVSAVAVVIVLIFGRPIQNISSFPALIYLPLPVLLWVSVRFGVRWTFSVSLLFVFISINNSSKGMGPFIYLSPAENVINLQVFLMLAVSPLMLLSVALEERRRAEAAVQNSLDEKEILLKEIHHRVKNNLQVISGLLDLQAHHIKDRGTVNVYKESQNRVITMALIHEKLYQSRDLARVDFVSYIGDLSETLFASYGVSMDRVQLVLDSEEVDLVIDTAIPCGLIVNELISNALKHAFPDGREGRIRVAFRSMAGDNYSLTVQDDGVGFPQGFDYRKTKTLGLQLVRVLIDQLGGTIHLLDRGAGTTFLIRFHEYREVGTILHGRESS